MAWQELHEFWFGDLKDGKADDVHRKNWFATSGDFDGLCSNLAKTLLDEVDGLADWTSDPQGWVSLIILCDQMPRNIYRGSADAFAWDHIALEYAKRGIHAGVDRTLGLDERAFFYMPFEHSEDLIDQYTCVGLFSALHGEVPADDQPLVAGSLRFAEHHLEIIQRYGRFPHRNRFFNRESTAAEIEYLKDSDGFGQGSG